LVVADDMIRNQRQCLIIGSAIGAVGHRITEKKGRLKRMCRNSEIFSVNPAL
jgi:hypothetical protein